MEAELAEQISLFLVNEQVDCENLQRLTKGRDQNQCCPYCSRTRKQILDSLVQQNPTATKFTVQYAHYLGKGNTVVLCSQCSIKADPRRGFNCLRVPASKSPTASLHKNDVKEVEDAVSSFELAKLSGPACFILYQTLRLKAFYARHGFTGIAHIDEQFAPSKEQVEESPCLFDFPIQDDLTIWNMISLPI